MKWKREVSPIEKYIRTFLTEDNTQLSSLAEEYEERNDTLPSIGPEAGKSLGLLIRLMQAKNVLEFGTCLGYSTIWLAQAMKEVNGKLTAVEYDKKFYTDTMANVHKAGLTDYVTLINGDASKAIKELDGPFDIIFQDSEKSLYPAMLERSIELVRKGGLLIADDTLFTPMGMPKTISEPMDEYNKRAFSDPRLYTTILPIGDGLTVSLKR